MNMEPHATVWGWTSNPIGQEQACVQLFSPQIFYFNFDHCLRVGGSQLHRMD